MNLSRGFTLVEMMIATTILMSVIMISSMGYSMFADNWRKSDVRFDTNALQAKNLLIIREIMRKVSPYVVPDNSGKGYLYFQGNRDSFVAFLGRGMFEPSSPSIARLRVEQEDDLSYSLIFEEYSLKASALTHLEQEFDYARSLVLLTGLADVEFNYFGTSGVVAWREQRGFTWTSTFNSLNRQVMPETVRLRFVEEAGQTELDFSINAADPRQLSIFNGSA